MAKGGHGKRKADGIPNLVQIVEGCRLLSSQPSAAPFDAVPTLRTFVSENSSGVQMSNFMEIIHDFKTSKNNTILLFVYITYFINFATKLYMLIYE